jgi:thiol:disulfide interchange protein
MTRKFFSVLMCLGIMWNFASAQVLQPVKWTFDSEHVEGNQYDLIFKAKIDDGWTIYSQYLESDDGPIRTSFVIEEPASLKKVGKNKETSPKRKEGFDELFEMNVIKFAKSATFTQRIEVKDNKTPIIGYLEFMACDKEKCLPPSEVEFEINLPVTKVTVITKPDPVKQVPAPVKPKPEPVKPVTAPTKPAAQPDKVVTNPTKPKPATEPTKEEKAEEPEDVASEEPEPTEGGDTITADSNSIIAEVDTMSEPSAGLVTAGVGTPTEETFDKTRFTDDCSGAVAKKEKRTHWQTFIKGIIGGFIALLTPCVFPMIPLTVSYFLKGGTDKKKGFRDAFIYGLAIIVLYTGLGTIVTAVFGADALNAMASNPWFNLALAILLVVFALSFFGYFNMELPSKWVDKTDAISDKGGLIGILGMAATLAIVSFSCTGPLIGVLLVDAVSQAGDTTGIPLGPIVGMFGFSLALALPFSLFAAFPSWLSSLPKSGGWMDDVKVSVGFIEVALSLKFLAVFSLIMESRLGFKVLPYEAFVALWVIIAILWGLYFLNLFKFKKDPYASTEKKKLPTVKLVLGVLLLALAGYNLMGFQTSDVGTFKPTNLMSGLAPPSGHSYIKPAHCPHAINCYHDYYVAKEVAKKENKPLFIDFTGYSCENCRRNEESIWPKEGIIDMLREDYIVVSLYVDEREKLSEIYQSAMNGRRRTVGQKWADFQILHMGSNTQPLYVLATVNDDNTSTILNKPLGNLISDEEIFRGFLECGLKVHEELSPAK